MSKKYISTLPKWVRVLVPSILIIVWVSLAGIGGPYFGKISEVASNDQSVFLPESAESTKVKNEIGKYQTENTIPAILIFSNDEKELSDAEVAKITAATAQLKNIEGVAGGVSPPIIADDKKGAFVVVNTESGLAYKEFLPLVREKIDTANVGVDYKITGPVGFINDLSAAFAGIDGLLLVVALSVVFVILLIVYRSPILPFVVLFNSLSALTVSVLLVWNLANAGIVEINGQVQGILFILVIGAATDYSLLYVSRYREELTRHKEAWRANLAALKGSFEPILAAGGTVIVGLMCLLLSDLNSNKALGPVGSIGILLAIISALTLLPALLSVFGRRVFWPRGPKYNAKENLEAHHTTGIWPKVGGVVSRNPRKIWVTITIVLAVCSLGLVGLRADGISQSDIVLGESEARDGQQLLNKHFPGGSGTPAQVIASEAHLDHIVMALDDDSGVSTIQVVAKNSLSPSAPIGKYEASLRAEIAEKIGNPIIAEQAYPFKNATPKVVDGNVMLEVTLTDSSESQEAQDTVVRLREAVHAIDEQALIGGVAATQLDTNLAAIHDRMIVIPVVLAVITVILIVLLRSIVAPIFLIFTTALSFAATLGIAAVIFNGVFQFPNSDPSVVLYGFVFLVALGIDYNIFLMTRVREESLKFGARKGVIKGLVVTGGVITSAGVVLAATFAALAVIPIMFLVQLAFIVAFGVLLDTIVVRSLYVPALVHDLGKKAWWPSKKIKD